MEEYVAFKMNGHLCLTTRSNYDARISDVRKIIRCDAFEDIDGIAKYLGIPRDKIIDKTKEQ